MLYKIIGVLCAGEIDRVVRVISQQEAYARLDLTTPVLVMAVRTVEQCESSVSMSISEEMQRTTITMQMQRTTITMQMKIEAMQKEIDAMQMRMRNGGKMN
ncbi:hypothetical protein RHGRI_037820 [Rhododendron griersonianum]|uniref:Uncharacterized protein n=1 Tax=Rhododendron griersonianum TaxID=479676 RepID=A0AAV6HTQ1_9ERIC|nr:hypothetical protein RHGRI_037820 [Rhododendron griersonianum]